MRHPQGLPQPFVVVLYMLLFRRLRSSRGSSRVVSWVHVALPALLPWLIPALLLACGLLLGSLLGSLPGWSRLSGPLAESQVPSGASLLSESLPLSGQSPAGRPPVSALVLVADRFGIDPVRFLVLSGFVSSRGWSGSGLLRYKEGDPLPCPLPLGPHAMDATSAYVAADQIASLVARGWDEVDAMMFFCFGPSWSGPGPEQSALRSVLMLFGGGASSGDACEASP